MTFGRFALFAALAAGALTAPAAAEPGRGRGDAERAFEATRDGRSMPLPLIEQRVVPRMRDQGAQYLGPEFRGRTYRLKFVSGVRVIWVDVDAATGRIINSKR